MGNHHTERKKRQKMRRRAEFAALPKPDPTDDDESFADRAIAASVDHAMGVSNPDYDWLVEPFE